MLDMSDTQPTAAQPDPPEEQPVQPTEPPAAPVAAAAPRTRLRDLVFGLRSLVAVALAGVILGGLAGFALNAATGGDDHRDGQMGRFGGPGGFRGGPDGGFQGGPGQMGPGGPGFPNGGPGSQQQTPQGGTLEAPSQTPTTSPS